MNAVKSFRGDYRFLSNFYPATVRFEGFTYPTVEHAYQAAKTDDQLSRDRIRYMPKPGDAKRAGRHIKLRTDWEKIKLDVMLDLLRQKFSNGDLYLRLQSTGDDELIEGNEWGDTFWGVCNGVGTNHLGRLLMQVRREKRNAT